MSSKITPVPSNNKIDKTKKIAILFMFIALALLILIFSVSNTMTNYRRLPKLLTSKTELAIRGDVVSSDNFKISSSKKLYKAAIDTRFLNLNKKELFIKLFSIYSNVPEKIVRKDGSDAIRLNGVGKAIMALTYCLQQLHNNEEMIDNFVKEIRKRDLNIQFDIAFIYI